MPFELTVERYKLAGNVTYFVRGAIVSEKRAIWTADDIRIDVTQSTADVKEITLKPAKAGAPGLDSLLRLDSVVRLLAGSRFGGSRVDSVSACQGRTLEGVITMNAHRLGARVLHEDIDHHDSPGRRTRT